MRSPSPRDFFSYGLWHAANIAAFKMLQNRSVEEIRSTVFDHCLRFGKSLQIPFLTRIGGVDDSDQHTGRTVTPPKRRNKSAPVRLNLLVLLALITSGRDRMHLRIPMRLIQPHVRVR